MNEKELKTIGYIVAGLIVLVVLFMLLRRVFEGLDKFLNALGITDSEAEKKAKEEIDRAEIDKTKPNTSPFDPNFYKQKGITRLKTKAGAEILASDIRKAKNAAWQFGDDHWKAIEKAFSYMTHKSHVSQTADAFRRLYGEDMLQWLQILANFETEKRYLANIIQRVNNLPKG